MSEKAAQVRTDLMVMLATQQQIVNYKAYKHYAPNRTLALCTEHAATFNWCHGFQELLGDRLVVLPPIPDSMMNVSRLETQFDQLLKGYLEKARGPVVWAWGGAQKPHAAALYRLARRYADNNPEQHLIVYAEGNSNAFFVDGQDEPIRIRISLTADEILTVHGLVVEASTRSPQVSSDNGLNNFLNCQKQREQEWTPPGYRADLERIAADPAAPYKELVNLVTQPLPANNTYLHAYTALYREAAQAEGTVRKPAVAALLQALKNACDNPNARHLFHIAAHKMRLCVKKGVTYETRPSGVLFEKHAQTRMMRWLEARGNKLVSSLRFDVNVYGINYQGEFGVSAPESAAQFDCMLVTPAGRLIAIDFKSAGMETKYRAQQSSVRLAGGAYADLYYLYPWIEDDLPPADPALPDKRPEIIRRRMQRIMHMDGVQRPQGKPCNTWRGIRFYRKDSDFFQDLENVLNLQQPQ